MLNTVDILGTEYKIRIVKLSEDDGLRENRWCGSCNRLLHEILIGDPSESEFFGVLSDEEQTAQIKRTLRHEVVHAFLNESGLQDDSNTYNEAWANNEEMVDWIAIQLYKIYDVYCKLDCLK